MSDEEDTRVDHKSTGKKKRSKKQDFKINPHDTAVDATENDMEENNELASKKPEMDKATQDIKEAQARKCYIEAGLCCTLLILAGIFIYLFEFTDMIRVRPEKDIYQAGVVDDVPIEYETVFLQDKKTCMMTLTAEEELVNKDPKDFTDYG